LYNGTFQYGYSYGEPIFLWFQTGLLVTPWISNIFSVELITVSRSNAEIISIQPAEDMFDDVVVCYNCSASPSPQCFPILWPFQVQSYHNPLVNNSYLWFLWLTPSPSGQCPYYFTFSFGIDSISIGVNIIVIKNYTLEVTVLGNAYQPRQLVYSTTQLSQGVISPEPFNVMWSVCITLFPSNSVSLQFPCLSTHAFTLDFFVHNVNIPLVDQNKPTGYLSIIAGSTASDVNILTFAPSWSLSRLCGWFSSDSLKSLDWILTDVQITLFSFRYNSTDNADTCKSPDGLRLFATGCNSTTLIISIASQQIVVTYKVANQPIPVQQLVFPFVYPFDSGLINITISGFSINIYTMPSYTSKENEVYNGMLENMDQCVGLVGAVKLMGPSCSSLKVFATQGFYVPPFHQGVSKGWMYATVSFISTTVICIVATITLATYGKFRNNPETQHLIAN
jgi:hypothetical protein